MKNTLYKDVIISKRLEHALRQLEHVTIFNNENRITPAQGGEDGRNERDFPRV